MLVVSKLLEVRGNDWFQKSNMKTPSTSLNSPTVLPALILTYILNEITEFCSGKIGTLWERNLLSYTAHNLLMRNI